jgi:hypothetical protein
LPFPDSENESQPPQSFCGNLTGTSSVVEFGPSTKELIFEFSRTDADGDVDSDGSFYNVTVRQIDCEVPTTSKLSNDPNAALDEYAEPKVDQARIQELDESCDRIIGAREFMVGHIFVL